MRVSPILPVAAVVATVVLSASPAAAVLSAQGERDGYQAIAGVIGHRPHPPHGSFSPTPTPILAPTATATRPTASPSPEVSSSATASSASAPQSPTAEDASPSHVASATPDSGNASSAATHTGGFTTPAGRTTGENNADGSGGDETGVVVGGLSVLLALAGGGLFWRRLRKKRRSETTRLALVTVPFGSRASGTQLALPPAADASAGQGRPNPQEQAPWEQPTLVDLRWAPSLPHAEHPVPGQGQYPYSQDPRQRLSQQRLQVLSPVENPFLGEDRDQPQVQHPPWSPGSPPPAPPAPGRHAAQHPNADSGPDRAEASAPAPGKRRKPQ